MNRELRTLASAQMTNQSAESLWKVYRSGVKNLEILSLARMCLSIYPITEEYEKGGKFDATASE